MKICIDKVAPSLFYQLRKGDLGATSFASNHEQLVHIIGGELVWLEP